MTSHFAFGLLGIMLAVCGSISLVKTILKRCSRSLDMIGATFVHIDSRGCMAEDRIITWVGIGRRVVKSCWVGHSRMIEIDIVQHTNNRNDSRDGGQGMGRYSIDDKSIQKLGKNLYFIFK